MGEMETKDFSIKQKLRVVICYWLYLILGYKNTEIVLKKYYDIKKLIRIKNH